MSTPVAALAISLAGMIVATPAFATLKPGATAPQFSLQAAKGGKIFTFDLADALKKGPVVVYFYPKSFTSTCTVEAHSFADAIPTFQTAGATVIGVSGDGIDTQREFSSKECRDTFPVGADQDLHVAKTYDAAMTIPGTSFGYANRISYVIAPGGTILSTLSDGDAEPHIQNALAVIERWRQDHPAAR